jgi:hypothetical protein
MRLSISIRQRAYALIKVVEKQCPKSPCAKLYFAVFAQAVQDAFMSGDGTTSRDKASGRRYLTEDMSHIEQLGIDPDWVKRKIKDAGLPLQIIKN